MRVFVNGETKEFSEGLRLHELLERLDLPARRIAVELNKNVIRQQQWGDVVVEDNDKIEIVHFVGGG
jgi:thiamine biosynthesis protein ThiS